MKEEDVHIGSTYTQRVPAIKTEKKSGETDKLRKYDKSVCVWVSF